MNNRTKGLSVEDINWEARAQGLDLEVRNFVGGRWQWETGGELIEKCGPRDGKLLYRFHAAQDRDVDRAVAEARQALEDGRWSKLPLSARKDALYKLALLIEEHSEELALLECVDVGKPIKDAFNFDIPGAAAILRFNAEAVDKHYGKVYGADRSSVSFELHQPIGVVGAITGWNFPLYLAAQKIGPALATGNSLILKPSEATSLSASRVAELAIEAGIPEGVFNVIHGGAGVGAALARHDGVDIISFTGSTHTGKRLMVASGESNLKRVLLECGGKAPNIVFDDTPDLGAAADAVAQSAFRNQGEVCVATSRLLIHADIKERFLQLLIDKVSKIKVGDPLLPATVFGAVVSESHQRKILDHLASGTAEGAQIAYHSEFAPPCPGGFYVSPCVFTNVKPNQRIAREEIFGPVLSVIEFRSESEAIMIANDTIYGLSAVLWTTNLGRAHRVSQSIHAGWVVVNGAGRPHGGPCPGVLSVGGHRQSGFGSEGGVQGLEEYVSKTAVQFFV